MKLLKFLKAIPKKFYKVAVIATIVSAAAIPFAVSAATDPNPWGPERPTFDYANGTNPGSTTGPVFNSFTNAPSYGDERNFATVSADGKADWKKNIKVTPGQQIQVRAYVHNDANTSTNGANLDGIGVAKNTRVRFNVPNGQASGFDVAAYVSADNATPARVYDTALVQNDSQKFSLKYVPGSAKMYNYATFSNGVALSDDVVGNNGALIGYNKLDGNLPGCFDYRATVIITLKIEAPALQFSKQVTKPGSTDWKSSLNAKTGDTVSWLLTFKNTGSAIMQKVVLRDLIPKDLTIVPGTVTWIDSNHPSGKVLPDTAITGSGVNLGDYTGNGAGGSIRFRTTVNKNPGECTITNVAYAKADNIAEQSAKASVVVEDCEKPKAPTYACNLLDLVQGDNRTVTLNKFEAPASNGATFKHAVIDWGDGSTPLTTNNVVGQKHTYAKDGTFTVSAAAYFTVNGKDQVAASESCKKTITFTPPQVLSNPPTLPNTGIGGLTAIFAATTAAATAAHHFVTRRNKR